METRSPYVNMFKNKWILHLIPFTSRWQKQIFINVWNSEWSYGRLDVSSTHVFNKVSFSVFVRWLSAMFCKQITTIYKPKYIVWDSFSNRQSFPSFTTLITFLVAKYLHRVNFPLHTSDHSKWDATCTYWRQPHLIWLRISSLLPIELQQIVARNFAEKNPHLVATIATCTLIARLRSLLNSKRLLSDARKANVCFSLLYCSASDNTVSRGSVYTVRWPTCWSGHRPKVKAPTPRALKLFIRTVPIT